MIIDEIKNLTIYAQLNSQFEKIDTYIRTHDIAKLPIGKYEIDGEKLFLVKQDYETKPVSEGVWEAHRRYIDFQYVIHGTEKIGYAPIETMKESTPYHQTDDFALFSGNGSFLEIKEGMFAVLYPEDVHMPSVQVEGPIKVKKAVFKIKIEQR